MRVRRVAAIAAAVSFILAIAFGVYLWGLYGQLKQAFNHENQFVPTRIYSDVTRISPPQPLSYVKERLKGLGYPYRLHAGILSFNLRSVDYPTYLIPEGHPVLDIGNQTITLHFDGGDTSDASSNEDDASEKPQTPRAKSNHDPRLRSIEVAGKEIPELFLEPELVATLSRTGVTGRDAHEIRSLVKFNDIPAKIWQAIIAVEDPRFLEHKGLDPRGIARAILVNLRRHSFAQGGSTITLQLVKNLMARHTKNIVRKFNELFLALLLELTFDKEQILERYLNEVNLGQIGNLEVHGVAEGAEHFFGKKLDDLNLAEIALMAGLIRGPTYYSPYRYMNRAMERQKLVLQKMVDSGQIAEEERLAALKMPIRLAPAQTSTNKTPYFTDFVKAELIRELTKRGHSEQDITEKGFRVYTTVDMGLNSIAQRAVGEGIEELEKRLRWSGPDRLEGALASVDPSTGYIRALVGGRSYSQSTFNRILNMKRQVGSTFKPIVYLSAFIKGKDPHGVPYGPGHPAEDAPWTLSYDHGKQSWTPKNYEKEFLGWISFRAALAHSVNTIAAKLGTEVGIENVIQTARTLGIQSDLPNVPSLALGVSELSPIELLKVYATIANHGIQDDLTVIRAIHEDDGRMVAHFVYTPKQVVDPGPSDLLTEMMENVFTEGTASEAIRSGFDRPAAGKTGTTSHHRDAWFAGFTPQIATVVWVGTDQTPHPSPTESLKGAKKPQPPIPLTGANSALQVWIKYMTKALESEAPLEFPISPYVSDVQIDTHTGLAAEAGCPITQVKTEKYVKGNEPTTSSCLQGYPTPEATP
jgi:penicillin-binding protein 1B